MKWAHYYRTESDQRFKTLWTELGEEPVLIVLGGGFDPRATVCLERLLEAVVAPVSVVRLALSDQSTDPIATQLADANRRTINGLVSESSAQLEEHPFPEVQARRSAGARISREFHERGYLEGHHQVVVDISGLPRSVYFPLISGLLQSVESETWRGDLHVAVAENPDADRLILSEGADAPGALGGFTGPPDDAQWAARVWIPVLGEGTFAELAALYEDIDPDEVVPVLPFPSVSPRRGDDLILEHRELLVDRIAVEPRNYMYAAESNPFDLYRAIHILHERYAAALRPLGAAKFVLSAHSSKLLSIGVLLAAFELGLQVMDVSPSRYGLAKGADPRALARGSKLHDLWLTGRPYS